MSSDKYYLNATDAELAEALRVLGVVKPYAGAAYSTPNGQAPEGHLDASHRRVLPQRTSDPDQHAGHLAELREAIAEPELFPNVDARDLTHAEFAQMLSDLGLATPHTVRAAALNDPDGGRVSASLYDAYRDGVIDGIVGARSADEAEDE